jgi:hypothetical protein
MDTLGAPPPRASARTKRSAGSSARQHQPQADLSASSSSQSSSGSSSRRASPPVFLQQDRLLAPRSLMAGNSNANGVEDYLGMSTPAADKHANDPRRLGAAGAGIPRDSQQVKPPKRVKEGHSIRAVDESSEDSYDGGGSYATDKIDDGAMNDGLGWFHAKIKVENSIQWANNYKIQSIMFILFIAGVAATIVLADNSAGTSVGLVCGSILTLVSCVCVMYTFWTRPTWQKHPNPLIFFRSLCDVGLVMVLLTTEIYKCARGDCKNQLTGASCSTTAGFTQFFLWSSESWFFVMAIDMFFSLKSPFTDYKTNVRRYHMFVWATGLLTAIVLVAIPDYAGPSEFGYCWTASKAKILGSAADPDSDGSLDGTKKTGNLWKLNLQSWVLFYIWLIFYWIYAIRYAWEWHWGK